MGNQRKNIIGKYTIYDYISPKMWAIIIMPIEIRVDNAHEFVHIHFLIEVLIIRLIKLILMKFMRLLHSILKLIKLLIKKSYGRNYYDCNTNG
jgi:hypothetical protein